MQSEQLNIVEKMLQDLQSENENLRKTAEANFNQSLASNLSSVTVALSQVACRSAQHEIRVMASILLRRTFGSDASNYSKLDAETKKHIKNACLNLLQGEANIQARRQVVALSNTISDLEMPQNAWPEFLPSLERMCKSENGDVRGDAFYLFGLVSSADGVKESDKNRFLNIFINGMKDADMLVRTKTVESFVTFSQSLTSPEEAHEVIKTILDIFEEVIIKKDSQHLTTFLESLIDLVTINPALFRSQLERVVKMMSAVAMEKSLEGGDRMLAMEFLVTMSEEDTGVYRSSIAFVQLCFMSALSLMMELNDDPNWINQMEEDDIEEEEMYGNGEFALDRLAQVFGSNRVVEVAMPLVMKLLEDQSNWKKRLVGIMAISQMGESIDDSHLEKLVRLVINYLNDQHVRVVFSAIHCIGQMSEDFSPTIQSKYHAQILPPLVTIIKDSRLPKIQAHAGAAIVNFVESIDPKVLTLYLEKLLEILFGLMPSAHLVVQEQIVTVIASMASSVPPQFHGHLQKIVPIILENYAQSTEKDRIIYKCKCLEALTFIGSELKGEKFSPVAHDLMKSTLSEVQQLRVLNVDYFDFVLQAWIRLAKVLKRDFAPYLNGVMVHLLETMKERDHSFDASVQGNSDSDEDYIPSDADINEIESAICGLSVFPAETGEHFLPYLEQSIKAAEQMLDYYGEENIRNYAAKAYGALYQSVVLAVKMNKLAPAQATNCMDTFLKSLLKCYVDENDVTIKKSILTAMKEILTADENISRQFLANNNDVNMLSALMNMLEIVKIRTDKLSEKRNDKQNDSEQVERYDNLIENENELLFKITEVFGLVVKVRKETLRGVFEDYMNKFCAALADENTPLVTKKAALLIIDDAILNVPQMTAKYDEFLAKALVNRLNDNDLDIKQSAVYGLGILAEKNAAVFAGNCGAVLGICLKLYEALLHNKEERFAALRDNAAAAYGRVAFACHSTVDLARSFKIWLAMLPLQCDLAEVKKSSEALFGVLASGNNKCLGDKLENFPAILNVLAAHFGKVDHGEAMFKQLGGVVAKIKTMPAESQKRLGQSLNGETKQLLGRFGA